MNTQEYISSGIIESYVLGLLSESERKEFEQACVDHPAILQARLDFEMALEKEALAHAMPPPAELKDRILAGIAPARVIEKSSSWWKYAAAACLVLLAGSLYWNITLVNKNQKLRGEFHQVSDRLASVENDIRIIQQNPNVKMATMKGMDVAPQAFATIYWDTTSKDVYLLVNNLPQPASDKQYQLWSILDGKPVDGGLIDNTYFIRQNKLLIRMKNAQGAQAFAITLEKTGGNPTPQGIMYVKGSL